MSKSTVCPTTLLAIPFAKNQVARQAGAASLATICAGQRVLPAGRDARERNTLIAEVLSVAFALVLLFGLSLNAGAQIIKTVAGDGYAGYTGDGGPATSAEFWHPWSTAPDIHGNIYITGLYYAGSTGLNERVRKVSTSGIVTTFAGGTSTGFGGDGGPATAAVFNFCNSVVMDARGNLYISDYNNFRIRKVDTFGIITTIAGTGTAGYTGDGGPATAAEIFGTPYYSFFDGVIACDPNGVVYVYSWGNYNIRKIDTFGTITTIAGNGTQGYTGDGGAATAAEIGQCYGIVADPYGNVYMADYNHNRIRKINSSGIISTIAGDGAAGFTGDGGPATTAELYEPLSVSADAAGNVLISDGTNRIRRVDAAGNISTICGTGATGFSGDGGPATAATLQTPGWIISDAGGNIYFSDYYNNRIREIVNINRPPKFTGRPSQNLVVCENTVEDSLNIALKAIDTDIAQMETWSVLVPALHGTVAGAYTTVSTGAVMTPTGLSYTPTTGYSGPDTLKEIVTDGFSFDTITVFVTVNPTPATITGAPSIVTGGYTTLYDTTSGGAWSSSNTAMAPVGTTTGIVNGVSAGTATITYSLPTGCNSTQTVNVFTFAGETISTIAGNGTAGSTGDGGAALSAELHTPWGAAVDESGNVYIADEANNRIRKVSPSGVISAFAGTGASGFSGDGSAATSAKISAPYDVAVDAAGNVYIADAGNNRIRMVNTSGIISTYAGNGTTSFSGDGSPATAAGLFGPSGLTVDASGNMYVCADGTRVRKINSSGIISTFAGNGTAGFSGDGFAATTAELHNPVSVATDGSGNVYIADQNNNRIRKVNSSGIITTITGTGTASYTGDGGSAATATVNNPWGIATDALGNIFIGDHGNNVIRRISATGTITTVAGNGTAGFSGDGCAATSGELNGHWGICVDGSGNVYIADGNNNRVRRINYNHAPFFNGGHIQSSSVCENSIDSVNTLLAVTDIDNGQGETWSVITSPVNGSLTAAYTATSTGGTITPTGLYYAPTIGYIGNDSFKVRVYDCGIGSDTTEVYITVTSPPSSILGIATVCPALTTSLSDPVGTGTWSSSSTTIATVSSTGLVTGVTTGTATITYSPGVGCSVTRTVTVNPAPAAITGPSFVCTGLTATLSDTSPGGAWSTGSSLASVGTGSGVVSGITTGSAMITYTQAGCIATKTISVNPVPGVVTGIVSVCTGETTPLFDGGGGVWSTATPAIATVDSFTGVATGISAGIPVITYTLPGGCTATDTLSVLAVPDTITGPTSVCVGSTITLTDATTSGFWSAPGIIIGADVDSITGDVTGVLPGAVTVNYTAGTGCSISTTIIVNAAPDPITGATHVCSGSTITLADGGGGAWGSGSPSIATVGSSSGVVNGVGPGTAIVTYTLAGCSAADTITVSPLPAAITGTTNVCVGLTTTLHDVTGGGAWSSSSTSLATVGSGSGIVTGASAGTVTISYTISTTGCAAGTPVTVNSSPGAITGVAHVCVGLTTPLGDPVSGGTWSSSAPSYATIVPSSGIVGGIATGTSIITYSLGAGCFSTTIVTVNPLPPAIGGTPVVCAGSTTTLSDGGVGTWSSSLTGTATVGASTGVVTGVAGPGVAIISFTEATGCYKTVPVTVNPVPPAISGPSTVCPGSTISLSDATGGGTWSSVPTTTAIVNTSGMVTGVAPGVATISYILGTGCLTTKPVTVNPLPTAIGGPATVCVGAAITLTDVGGGTWGSTSSTVTVGGSSGTVTGLSAGTAVITYTVGTGCYTTKTITVNPLPVITGPTAVCPCATISLSSPGSGTWMSLTTSVATVNPATGLVTGVSTGTSVISYTLPAGGCASSVTVTVSPGPTAIIGPTTACVGIGTALGDAVTSGVWSSSNPGAATIGSLSGIVTGVTPGLTTIISYSLGTGCTVSMTMTVVASPAAIAGSGGVCIGVPTTLTDGTGGGAWSSSNTAVAGVAAGTVTGVSADTATIFYTVGGCAATKIVTVNPMPSAITGTASVCAGATITEADGVSGGIWSPTVGGIGTVGSGTGIVTGVSGGTVNITYSIGTCTATRIITVSPTATISGPTGVCTGTTSLLGASVGGGVWSPVVGTVATVGATTGIVTGIDTGTAAITYTTAAGCQSMVTITVNNAPTAISGTMHVCAGSTTGLSNGATGGTWSVSPGTIASIGASTGILTGNSAGTANVTYSLGSGCVANATITVNAAPAAITGATQVCSGLTITLGEVTGGGIWSSDSTMTATVGTSVVTGVAAGTATISYTLGSGATSCSATTEITVNPVPAPITGAATLCVGLTSLMGDTTTGGTWSITPTSTATISATGMVTGIAAGTATTTFLLATGCMVVKPIVINSAPTAITGSGTLCIGSSITLGDVIGGGTWSSDALGIATVGVGGIVNGISTGTADISYSAGGCPVVKTITVNPMPPGITSPGQICMGSTITLSDPAAGGTWSSSNGLIASIGTGTGVVSGASTGVVTITYFISAGCTVTTPITVNPLPPAITGVMHVCVGGTTSLGDPAGGGFWSSGNTGICTVGPSGTVSGVSGGSAAISYTVSTGCSATAEMAVIFVPAITGVHDLCAWGDTMTVSDTNTTGVFTSSLVTATNLGGGNGIALAHAPGVATITYVVPYGCYATSVFTVNPLPGPITGNDHICAGLTSALGDASPGGTWGSPGDSGIVTIDPASGVATGVSAGTGIVTYTLPTGCHTDTSVTVSPQPSAISGLANLCAGTVTAFSDSVTGGAWGSSNTAVASVGAATGVVTAVSAGVATITYTMGASCAATKTITVNPLPLLFITAGGGNYCAGGTGEHVWLSGSQTGVQYVLYHGTSVVDTVTGTGGSLDFGLQTITGTYTVMASNIATSCSLAMVGSAVIGINPPPAGFTVTGGGSYCAGGTGVHVGLGGSAAGVNYQLYHGTGGVGSAMGGTGTSLDFGLYTAPGVYKVMATITTTGCTAYMADSVVITITPTVTPSVHLAVAPSDTVCSGTSVTFTPTSVNGGASPAYLWKVNGAGGTAGATYTYTPANGDVVSALLTSNANCAQPDTASSTMAVTVDPQLLPTVTITAIPGTSIGPGQYDTLIALVTNGGTSPTYQWEVNGIVIAGATADTFIRNNFADSDMVSCIVTSNGACGGHAGTKTVMITVVNVGVLMMGGRAEVTVIPNPNKGEFTVIGSLGTSLDEEVTLELTDMLGQVVYKDRVRAQGGMINARIKAEDNLANGVYLLNLHSDSDNKVFHVVIEK